jgi:hypothetical protein
MIHFSFYVPLTHLEMVKKAVFDAGGGRIGHYDFCSFETKGLGQFRPLSGGQPFLGRVGEIKQVEEAKVELVCEEKNLAGIVAALKKSHPYETPAYYAIKTVNC